MKDLIDRQTAIDVVEESRRLNPHKDGKEARSHECEHRHFLKILKDLPSAQQNLTCSECLYFEQDHFEIVSGVPLIVAHDICMKWGDGCKTDPQGYCFMGVKK